MSRVQVKHQELLTKPIRVAVLGSGGREHALAKKLAESPLAREVIALPGNDGMARAGLKCVATELKDHAALAARLHELKVELVVVGPDDLLAAGVVDALEAEGFAVFGPRKAAAKLEWSKSYAKQMMLEAGIPTAGHEMVESADLERLESVAAKLGGYPLVLKYDGLALGKGVCICVDRFDAEAFVRDVFEHEKFGKAGAKAKAKSSIVAEQFLIGHEVSLFAITDGETYAVLEPACDHKRLGEGNAGPNTGGMGAYSPVPWLSPVDVQRMSEAVFPPLLAKMRESKLRFQGLLYAGLMVRAHEFWVLEFNARFGDPETQAILPRLRSDLLVVLYGAAMGTLERHLDAAPLRWTDEACVNIVLASRGYPEKPETGFAISGLPESALPAGESVYFAGVLGKGAGLVSSGGRVLSVSALAESVDSARLRALDLAAKIQFEGVYHRRDIGSVRSNY